MNVIYWCGIY